MATVPFRMSGDARRHTSSSSSSSNRIENRHSLSTTLCRNGPQCRKFQEGTCNFNHDFTTLNQDILSMSKRSLTVESPAFLPRSVNVQPTAAVGMTSKAVAAAAAFTPRGSGTVTPAVISHNKEPSADMMHQQAFQPTQAFAEFIPGQNFLATTPQLDAQLQAQIGAYNDPFLTQSTLHGLSSASVQVNPYAQSTAEAAAPQFYQDASSYRFPLNYHLYTPIGPQRSNLLPYQRSAADFFIPDDLREELQRKSEAALQTFANSTLPHTVEYFHSLVALDTGQQKGAATFGYSSWVYKATSYRDGRTYALRRLEGFKLSNAHAIRSIQAWKRIVSANLVQVHDAFTGRWFGDSSLVVVTDYHPRSQTLAEKYFAPGRNVRLPSQHIEESELWAYLVQLANVLKTVHEAGLAAQTITPSKILVTAKGRIRLNGCGVFDILNFEQKQAPHELQRSDLASLGRLVLSIAARSINANANTARSLEQVGKTYGERLKTCLQRLVMQSSAPLGDPSGQTGEFTVQSLLTSIADKVISTLDSAFEENDQTTAVLMRELENGRLVRLLAKLNIILERPDTSSTPIASNNPALLNQPSAAWSETGERYYLKLFRDYVFHQVDHEGRPVLDLGHIITCLNKLDAGIEEKIQLVSRDEQHVCVVSYKEVKRGFESAWQEIHKAANPTRK